MQSYLIYRVLAIFVQNSELMKLKIALCQTDIVWGDISFNLENAEKFIRAADADLVVLPEMFSTGFEMEPSVLAETMEGKAVKWLKNTASQSGKAIVCSMIIKDNGPDNTERYYNRLFFATPEGKLYKYDKRHLFSFSGEDRNYTGGEERIIVDYKGFRILPLICYDLRFPVWSRGSDEFDLMIYIASWPSSRIKVWDTLLKARAIENQSYVAGANRVGTDPSAIYDGHTAAIDFYGEAIATANNGMEDIVVAELDLDALRSFREKFPAWRDSDRFEIF